MQRSRKLLVVLLTLGTTIGTAIAIEKGSDEAESNASSKELLEAARTTYEIRKELYRRGAADDAENLYVWSKRWMMAERGLDQPAEAATKAVNEHLDRMKELEAIAKARHEAARATAADVTAAKYYRAEAELMLAGKKE